MQDKNKSTTEIFEDSLFKMAVYMLAEKEGRAAEEKLKEYSAPSELKVAGFKKLLTRLQRKARLKSVGRYSAKFGARACAVLMAVISIGFIAIMSVEALRVNFTKFLLTFTPTYTELILQPDGTNTDDSELLLSGLYEPKYVPDGFEVKSLAFNSVQSDIFYENNKEQYMHFFVYTVYSKTHIDTENADKIETIKINGGDGLLVVEGETVTLTWQGKNCYFLLITNISESETVKIAESVRHNDKKL